MIFDLIMLCLVILRCVRENNGQAESSLGRIFIAQGLTTFVTITALNTIVSVIYWTNTFSLYYVGLPFQVVLPSILSCRMILQLRLYHFNSKSIGLTLQSRLVQDAFVRAEALEQDATRQQSPIEMVVSLHPTDSDPSSSSTTREDDDAPPSPNHDPWLSPFPVLELCIL